MYNNYTTIRTSIFVVETINLPEAKRKIKLLVPNVFIID